MTHPIPLALPWPWGLPLRSPRPHSRRVATAADKAAEAAMAEAAELLRPLLLAMVLMVAAGAVALAVLHPELRPLRMGTQAAQEVLRPPLRSAP